MSEELQDRCEEWIKSLDFYATTHDGSPEMVVAVAVEIRAELERLLTEVQEREEIWLKRLFQADQRFGAELARHLETQRKAREVSEELRGLIRELLQFIPYEKPEQGPLPNWIVDVAERAQKAAGLHE